MTRKKTTNEAFIELSSAMTAVLDEARIAMAPKWYRDDKDRLNRCVIEQKKRINELTRTPHPRQKSGKGEL